MQLIAADGSLHNQAASSKRKCNRPLTIDFSAFFRAAVLAVVEAPASF
jgi:hypothetical protein